MAHSFSLKAENRKFEVISLPHAKLHVYNSGDAMADASYIVEGEEGLVTLETPLFKENLKEFEQYLGELGKPVLAELADYHLGGTFDRPLIMAEGMGSFTKEGPYAAMMDSFRETFGDSIVELPKGNVTEVPFGESITLAGIEFAFSHGSDSDFPAAAILIDGTALLTHWAPAKSHLNALQLGSRAAVDAELVLLEAMKASGASYFIGGHGRVAGVEALDFKTGYVEKVKALLSSETDSASFASALVEAFPGLPGEEGVKALAEALYK
ncbi:MAG: hypothetical protein ACI399_06800 [Candidatus Cryptobacteroides sp.]